MAKTVREIMKSVKVSDIKTHVIHSCYKDITHIYIVDHRLWIDGQEQPGSNFGMSLNEQDAKQVMVNNLVRIADKDHLITGAYFCNGNEYFQYVESAPHGEFRHVVSVVKQPVYTTL